MTERLIGVIMACATGMELAHSHWLLAAGMLVLALGLVTDGAVN